LNSATFWEQAQNAAPKDLTPNATQPRPPNNALHLTATQLSVWRGPSLRSGAARNRAAPPRSATDRGAAGERETVGRTQTGSDSEAEADADPEQSTRARRKKPEAVLIADDGANMNAGVGSCLSRGRGPFGAGDFGCRTVAVRVFVRGVRLAVRRRCRCREPATRPFGGCPRRAQSLREVQFLEVHGQGARLCPRMFARVRQSTAHSDSDWSHHLLLPASARYAIITHADQPGEESTCKPSEGNRNRSQRRRSTT